MFRALTGLPFDLLVQWLDRWCVTFMVVIVMGTLAYAASGAAQTLLSTLATILDAI